MELDAIDRRIINSLQGGFPVCEQPYAVAAQSLGIAEEELIARIEKLVQDGVLSRFGPLFNADRLGGTAVLAAMAVPEAQYEAVAETVNAQTEIAHNYRREHALNMWFIGSAEQAESVEAAFVRIEKLSGHPVYRFPKEREYFVELKLTA
jgi:DNA-binding Lrp family transcriptional regulator